MDRERYDAEWDRRYSAIQDRARSQLPEGAPLVYSAFTQDEQTLPVDNLDKVAVEGRCVFIQKHDPYHGEGKNYMSAEYENPTWMQVCWVANEMIHVTGDAHHVFLEGVRIVREDGGVKYVNFDMGS